MPQRLVVLSGYPRSGKSTVTKFMQEELGFARLSIDDLRYNMYGMSFPEMVAYFGGGDFQSPEYQREEELLRDVLQIQKMAHLMANKSVVLGGTFGYNQWRWELLCPSYGRLHHDSDIARYLIMVDVDRKELERRALTSARDPSLLRKWDEFWEEPDFIYPGEGTPKLVRVRNNNTDDFSRSQDVLRAVRST